MDFTKTVTHLEFAAGYAGIGLGIERVIPNVRAIAYVEIEAFAVANLVAKMEAGLLPAAPVWTDIKTFPSSEFCGIVDILSAGYPCQPFSAAGKRKGKQDPRHLWPYIKTAIGIIQPGICFFENVEGHLSLGLDTVLSDLGELGYEVEAGLFSASEVGATHQRKRVFILGIREGYELDFTRFNGPVHGPNEIFSGKNGKQAFGDITATSKLANPGLLGQKEQKQQTAGLEQCSERGNMADSPNFGCGRREDSDGISRRSVPEQEAGKQPVVWCEAEGCSGDAGNGLSVRKSSGTTEVWPSRPNQPQPEWEPPRVVGNTNSQIREVGKGKAGKDLQRIDSNGGAQNERQTQSSVGGDANGNPDWMDYAELYESGDNRTDELRLNGNGVVPATVEKAFRTLYSKLISG